MSQTLILFGASIKFDNEIEIFSEDEFGMDITVDYKDGKQRSMNNCTEFHHLFDSHLYTKASAFESDIHGTGCTQSLDRISKITVVKATKKHEEY